MELLINVDHFRPESLSLQYSSFPCLSSRVPRPMTAHTSEAQGASSKICHTNRPELTLQTSQERIIQAFVQDCKRHPVWRLRRDGGAPSVVTADSENPFFNLFVPIKGSLEWRFAISVMATLWRTAPALLPVLPPSPRHLTVSSATFRF